MRSFARGLVAALALASCTTVLAAGTRDDEPVQLSGAGLPDLVGTAVGDLAVFVWDPDATAYVPIPFQVDERVLSTFNEGTPFAFTQLMYDVAGADDGLLDANDEIAFMYRDSGLQRAPSVAPWPSAAGELSYEVAVNDPRSVAGGGGGIGLGSPAGQVRYVYVFAGSGLARSPQRYLTWTGAEDQPASSDRFEVGFAGRWLVNSFRVFSPCGAGTDLIDRVKGRALPLPTRQEDEDGWNDNSTWLGSRLGPVRAIRYVRGANSGVNTILQDVVYRGFWERTVHLRVHPLHSARLYIDWLPGTGRTQFLSTARGGLTVDGQPDAVLPTLPDWSVMRTPAGGGAVIYNVPASPRVTQRALYYKDDKNFNDEIEENPNYDDDDDAAYGATGVEIAGLADSQVDPILLQLRVYPLCANDGSPALGDAITEIISTPLQIESTPRRAGISPIRTLRAVRVGADVRLNWEPTPNADSYRVFTAPDPTLPQGAWTLLASPTAPPYTDAGAGTPQEPRYYSVVAVVDGQQGAW